MEYSPGALDRAGVISTMMFSNSFAAINTDPISWVSVALKSISQPAGMSGAERSKSSSVLLGFSMVIG